jgi:hypothetical protein
MNITDDFDKFLEEHFQNAKYDIKDEGFSEKVISNLPNHRDSSVKRNIILFISCIFSLIIFIVAGGSQPIISSTIEIINKSSHLLIPSVTSLIVFISFALIIAVATGLRFNRSTF